MIAGSFPDLTRWECAGTSFHLEEDVPGAGSGQHGGPLRSSAATTKAATAVAVRCVITTPSAKARIAAVRRGGWVKADDVAGRSDGRILCAHEQETGNAATGAST